MSLYYFDQDLKTFEEILRRAIVREYPGHSWLIRSSPYITQNEVYYEFNIEQGKHNSEIILTIRVLESIFDFTKTNSDFTNKADHYVRLIMQDYGKTIGNFISGIGTKLPDTIVIDYSSPKNKVITTFTPEQQTELFQRFSSKLYNKSPKAFWKLSSKLEGDQYSITIHDTDNTIPEDRKFTAKFSYSEFQTLKQLNKTSFTENCEYQIIVILNNNWAEILKIILPEPVEEKVKDQEPPKTQRELLSDALTGVHNYLDAAGWKVIDIKDLLHNDNDLGQVICPQTGRTHDIDYAFTLQLERNRIEHDKKSPTTSMASITDANTFHDIDLSLYRS